MNTEQASALAASEQANAAFLRMAYPGSCVWFGTHTCKWWGMLPRGQKLMCAATAESLGAEFARAMQPVMRHAPP